MAAYTRAAFLLGTFLWPRKEKYLAFGCENPIQTNPWRSHSRPIRLLGDAQPTFWWNKPGPCRCWPWWRFRVEPYSSNLTGTQPRGKGEMSKHCHPWTLDSGIHAGMTVFRVRPRRARKIPLRRAEHRSLRRIRPEGGPHGGGPSAVRPRKACRTTPGEGEKRRRCRGAGRPEDLWWIALRLSTLS